MENSNAEKRQKKVKSFHDTGKQPSHVGPTQTEKINSRRSRQDPPTFDPHKLDLFADKLNANDSNFRRNRPSSNLPLKKAAQRRLKLR